MKTNRTSRRDGTASFSLIELVAVIGVLAIIFSLLMPVLSSAKNSTNLATCQSNLKQLGIACMSYCGDNRGKFPGRVAPGTTASTEFSWVGGGNKDKGGYFSSCPGSKRFLSPYVGITDDFSDGGSALKIARCPVDTGAHQPGWSGDITGKDKKYWEVCGTSYGAYNWDKNAAKGEYGIVIYDNSTPPKEVSSRLLSGVRSPDRYVVMYETGGFFQLYHATDSGFKINPEAFWHSAKGGYKWGMVYADGHCGYVAIDSNGQNLLSTDQYTCDPTK